MKLKSFNKINTSCKTTYMVYDKQGNAIDHFHVDYVAENLELCEAVRKRTGYENAKVLWCDPSLVEKGRLMVGIEVD